MKPGIIVRLTKALGWTGIGTAAFVIIWILGVIALAIAGAVAVQLAAWFADASRDVHEFGALGLIVLTWFALYSFVKAYRRIQLISQKAVENLKESIGETGTNELVKAIQTTYNPANPYEPPSREIEVRLTCTHSVSGDDIRRLIYDELRQRNEPLPLIDMSQEAQKRRVKGQSDT